MSEPVHDVILPCVLWIEILHVNYNRHTHWTQLGSRMCHWAFSTSNCFAVRIVVPPGPTKINLFSLFSCVSHDLSYGFFPAWIVPRSYIDFSHNWQWLVDEGRIGKVTSLTSSIYRFALAFGFQPWDWYNCRFVMVALVVKAKIMGHHLPLFAQSFFFSFMIVVFADMQFLLVISKLYESNTSNFSISLALYCNVMYMYVMEQRCAS